MKISMMKQHGHLMPATEEDAELVATLDNDKRLVFDVVQTNDLIMHRRMFALFKLGFDAWEPDEVTYKDEVVEPSFNRFRKDITILAGYHSTVIDIRGEARVEAISLAFGKMTDEDKRKLFVAVSNVLLRRVLGTDWNQDEIDQYVDRILGFA